MWGKFCLAFVVAVIGGTILSIIEVDAQSTMNNSASSHESSTFDEAVNLIREDLQTCVRSNDPQNNASRISKRDLEDLKAACASNQQQTNESCISKKDFEELKTACASNQQPSRTVNASCEYIACLINGFRGDCWRCGKYRQVASLSQRDRAAVWSVLAESGRRYSADNIGLSLTTVTQRTCKCIKFGELQQNNGYYAIQGHSGPSRSVPSESPYATSF